MRFLGSSRASLVVLSLLVLSTALAGVGCRSDSERLEQHLADAREARAQKDYRAATLQYRLALQAAPSSALVNRELGELMEEQGQLADALFFYQEAHRLDAGDALSALRLGLLLRFDEPERARELIDGVVEREPKLPLARVAQSELALATGDSEAALAAVLTAVELAPEDPDGYWQLGYVRQAQIRENQVLAREPDDALFEAAIGAYDRYRELGGATAWIATLEQARTLHAWPGHADEAGERFFAALEEALVADQGAAVQEISRQALAFAQERDAPELRRRILERLVAGESRNPSAWTALARSRAEQDGPEAGIEVLRTYVEQQPGETAAWRAYASFLADEADDVAGAAALLDRALAEAPESVDRAVLLRTLATLQRRAGQAEQADATVAELARKYPEQRATALAQAQAAQAAGRFEEARDILRASVSERESGEALAALAQLEDRLGRSDLALRAMERALELTPGFHADLKRIHARLLRKTGDSRAALAVLRELAAANVKLTPLDALLLAELRYETGSPEGGRKLLKELLQHAGNAPVPIVVAYSERERDNPAERENIDRVLGEALAKRPDHPGLVRELVALRLAEGQPDAARKALDEVLAGPQAPAALWLLSAQLRMAGGELEAARGDLERALALDPELPGAPTLLAKVQTQSGQTDEALKMLSERETTLSPEDLVMLAGLRFTAADHQGARRALERALAARGDLATAKNALAYLLAVQGEDLDRALTLAQEARAALNKAPEVADTLGFVFLQRGLPEAALTQFREAIELAPDGSEGLATIHYHEGLALRALAREDDAQRAFDRALGVDQDFEPARAAKEGRTPQASREPRG